MSDKARQQKEAGFEKRNATAAEDRKDDQEEQQKRELVSKTGGLPEGGNQQVWSGGIATSDSYLLHAGATEKEEAAKAELERDRKASEEKGLRGAVQKNQWIGGEPRSSQVQSTQQGPGIGSGKVVPESKKD